jgi:hypothetical protein
MLRGRKIPMDESERKDDSKKRKIDGGIVAQV